MSIKNGDLPAMPVWCRNSDQQLYGLSKREKFAMAMAHGLLGADIDFNKSELTDIATDAVALADALLAELEKSK